MFVIVRTIFFLSILTLCCSFNGATKVEKGNVVYRFESGKVQCLSEIDGEGHIFVLLKSLNGNTTVDFKGVSKKVNVMIVKVLLQVEEDTKLCASWVNMQELSIEIHPLVVKAASLKGEIVHRSKEITVMM